MHKHSTNDPDPTETEEWVDALEVIIQKEGMERAHYILKQLSDHATRTGTQIPYALTTPYRNTIPVTEEAPMPGDLFMERRIRSLVRWNALITVMRANMNDDELGGHISTFQSSATLYDVGFNYFWHAPSEDHMGDLIYFQGHSSPGIYARSYIEGRFDEAQMDRFRREVDGGGLSSYPHPWLMPDYWQFPTVSMGLGPLQAIYQAHIMRYMSARGLAPREERKVWAFLGDGEIDEPESLGAISLAGREQLENLIFVVNCNLQRLDGPVRGNSKIIQELEGVFRGAGWNVIKVVWGRLWDPLLAKDKEGVLQRCMDETVDGEYQNCKANGGAYTREHFFGKYPETLAMVEDLTDAQIYKLNRGGHDPYKVYAAYHEAVNHKGQPTVILAHTVKGYGVGDKGEAQMGTHSLKKLDKKMLMQFRDRYEIPLSDDELDAIPYYRPPADRPEMQYMKKRRDSLGGYLPQRRNDFDALEVPGLEAFENQLKGTGEREISTTMAFVRLLSVLVKDKKIGPKVVPIVPDEARTFGMEGMFRQLGIYSSSGQLYEPVDSAQVMYYKEDKKGQMLEEGINEAGALSAWLTLATAYSNYNCAMIPFYVFYSMFGFQRVGDLCWAAGDMQARGFLIGGTSGRTTLNGEGLQHQDGHSHILASTVPNCISYDATFSYEVAVIVQDGMRRMYQEKEAVYYYLTLLNENYSHPDMPKGAEAGIVKGLYLFQETPGKSRLRVQLIGSGSIMREVIAAAELLREEFKVDADIWAATSFNELAREGQSVERWNMLHPQETARISYVTQCFADREGPVIAATDYMKNYADQIRAYVPKTYRVLGTDGFGRSDSRQKLRHFFEVDRYFITIAALQSLLKEGKVDAEVVSSALTKFGIDPNKSNPVTV
ncbi:MAG: pyruvate dehydrogenase (acetyl-transferring), homodimeric type [Pseudomonadales bacterium]|nr:pyruvate dehydrogenase (acetyl-transferring), homodimeric type [Pseudomonadales bacterium]